MQVRPQTDSSEFSPSVTIEQTFNGVTNRVKDVAQPVVEAAARPVTPITRRLSRKQRLVKRGFDLCLTIPGLVLLAPVFILVALAVWLDSDGPVFFRQQRIGEGGQEFWMFKFRTMVQDAEARATEVKQTNARGETVYKHSADPRVTRVGRLLRRTSIDELPQLLNVLRGDMSLVGPRPEQPWIAATYQSWQWQRCGVPQGLTCLWQIRGRSNRPLHLNTQDDIEYIENYSFWLDIQIMLRTLEIILNGKGAF